MRSPDPKEQTLTLPEGMTITYRTTGVGRPVLLANGLAARAGAWDPLVARLGSGYQFVRWDYRGLTVGHGHPCGPAEHARDALALLDALGVERVAVIGWSMGTQVLLELFAAAPQRVASLVLIGGGARSAWGLRQEATFPGKLVPRALGLASRVPRASRQIFRRLLRSPEAYAWARRLGLVGGQFDDDDFAEVIRDFDHLDFDAYLEMLARLSEHDASEVISAIDVPTLVIAAGRDPVTSRAALERIVTGVEGAEYLVLPDATHFALIDHADHIALRIKKFFSERGYAPADSVRPEPV